MGSEWFLIPDAAKVTTHRLVINGVDVTDEWRSGQTRWVLSDLQPLAEQPK